NYAFWYRKAKLQESGKDSSGALKSYRYAIKIYPSPDAMLAAANLLAEKKDSTAILICRQIEGQRMGREYTAHCAFISGVYYARTGQYDKALTAFNRCINNYYQYTEAYMEKGFLLYDANKTAEALQVFKTLVAIKNTYVNGYYWIAKCNEKLSAQSAAIEYYQKALLLDPNIPEARAALKRLGVK
ncbi:MAG: hypothetical protein RLZZ28_2574, partial [Bacteroidota bacterium]